MVSMILESCRCSATSSPASLSVHRKCCFIVPLRRQTVVTAVVLRESVELETGAKKTMSGSACCDRRRDDQRARRGGQGRERRDVRTKPLLFRERPGEGGCTPSPGCQDEVRPGGSTGRPASLSSIPCSTSSLPLLGASLATEANATTRAPRLEPAMEPFACPRVSSGVRTPVLRKTCVRCVSIVWGSGTGGPRRRGSSGAM